MQRCTSDQCAVHIFTSHQFGRIGRFDRATVEDPYPRGGPSIIAGLQFGPQRGMDFLGLGGPSGAAGADGPHRLVGEVHAVQVVRGDARKRALELSSHGIEGLALIPLLQRLAHTEQHPQAPIEGHSDLASEQIVGFAESVPSLGVSNQRHGAATVDQHGGGDLPCKGSGRLIGHILSAGLDPPIADGLRYHTHIGMRRKDRQFDRTIDATGSGGNLLGQCHRGGSVEVHLPVPPHHWNPSHVMALRVVDPQDTEASPLHYEVGPTPTMKPTTTECMSAAAIRQSYLDFFRDRAAHTIVPSGPVVPHDDPTLLFANAGMNQFKDVFLGTGTRPWTRVVDTQKCIRAGGKHNDLEDVGRDTWHHTFFEMLGNWSFGDYFKAEAIAWAWELLTEVWGLPKDRLYVSVFAGDEAEGLEPDTEAERLWLEKTDIDPTHISRWGKKDNFWEMGASGPCGPCSEIHFDSTPEKSGGPLVNLDHPDVIEFWNLVFIQYNRREDGRLVPLPAKHVDTGMGLERIVRVLQGVRSNYDTDLWTPIFEAIQRETGAAAYGGSMDCQVDTAYRVIADHVRCLVVAMTDGAMPGPDGRGFVLRRILRRGVRMARQALGAQEPLLRRLVPTVVESLSAAFPELIKAQDGVAAVIGQEEEAFLKTLDRGLALFADAAAEAKAGDGRISGEQAFLLHDTFGFPIDLTAQMAEEQSITLDRDGYESAMKRARAQSRCEDGGADLVAALPPEAIAALEQFGGHGTDDAVKYERSLCIGHVLGIWNGENLVEHVAADARVAIVLDRTSFYAEQGGQVGDTGQLITEAEGDSPGGIVFRVENTTRSGPWVLHIGHLVEGRIHLGAAVDAKIDPRRHAAIESNHTATHLLNRALRSTLGEHCDQRGSLVAPDRLRFDYAAREAPDITQLTAIERAVRADIAAGLVVDTAELSLDVAMGIAGIRAVFGEQYPDPVRVVCVGAPVAQLAAAPNNEGWRQLSTEFCGGTHIADTADIGDFIIMQEQGLAAGIRRVVAATGDEASQARQAGDTMLDRLNAIASLGDDELPGAVDAIARELNDADLGLLHRRAAEQSLTSLRDTAKKLRKAAAGQSKDAIVAEAQALAREHQGNFIVGELTASDRETLLAGMDAVRGIAADAACLLACTVEDAGKVIIVAKVPQSCIDRGLKAGDWVRVAAEACGGGGGGRPDAAQAGGKQPEKLPEALAAATTFAQEALT